MIVQIKIYNIRALIFLSFMFKLVNLNAQLSGSYSIPGTHTSIASIINDLNTLGVNGAVTINISSGYIETTPIGGFVLTASGSSLNPIVFKKNGIGSNPVISSYIGGVATSSSSIQDGIWAFVGSDYVTVDGVDLVDVNVNNPSTMEYGFAFFKSSSNDGCNNNLIKNCAIKLNRNNVTIGQGPSYQGSRAINVVNALYTSQNTTLNITSGSGSNSNNSFFNNVIDNSNIGFSLFGNNSIVFPDSGNDIGGNSAVTSNTILNFGGGNSNDAYGVICKYQKKLNVSNNLINNNNGNGINHNNNINAIIIFNSIGSKLSISDNTITLHYNGTTNNIEVLANYSSIVDTVKIDNNLVHNCTSPNMVSGDWGNISSFGGVNTLLSISNNSVLNNYSNVSSGNRYFVYSSTAANISNFNSNYFSSANNNTVIPCSGSIYGIYVANSQGDTINISNNNFGPITHSLTQTGDLRFIQVLGGNPLNLNINYNNWSNLNLNHSGNQDFIRNNAFVQNQLSISNNTVQNIQKTSLSNGSTFVFNIPGFTSPNAKYLIKNNIINNYTIPNGGINFTCLSLIDGGTPFALKEVSNNRFTNIFSMAGNFTGILIGGMGSGNTSSTSVVSNNLIDGISIGGSIIGISVQAETEINVVSSVNSNTISNLNSSSNSGTIRGIGLNGNVNNPTPLDFLNVFKNRIYNLNSTGVSSSIDGIYISTNTSCHVYNNLIGAISATNLNSANNINGINIDNGKKHSISFNTIFLSGTSSGTLFGSSAISSSTLPILNLRNNILINNCISVGGGKAVAFRRSGINFSTYDINSNNNLFYSGVPSNDNLIYYDGFNSIQTISSYTSLVFPSDVNSVTENPNFTSIIGSNINFLNINNTIPTLIESGAFNIPSIIDDYNTSQRNISTPDIGAWEGNYTQIVTCNGSPFSGTASISNSSGCANTNIILSTNGASTGAGLSYQWFSSSFINGPWALIPNANGNNFQTSTSSLTFYRVVITCSFTSLTDTSNIVSFSPINCYSLNSGTISTCSGIIYDSGGLLNSYQNNESYTLTIYPTSSTSKLQLNFLDFNLDYSNNDFLKVYDGPNVNSNLVGTYYNFMPPNSIITATNITGALTLVFYSNTFDINGGFSGLISCTNTCNGPPLPPVVSGSTICSGNSVSLSVTSTISGQIYWYTSSNTLSPIAQGSVFVTPTLTSNISYYVVDSSSCGSSQLVNVSVQVSPCMYDNEIDLNNNAIIIYPNSNSGIFEVDNLPLSTQSIELIDMTGRVLLNDNKSEVKKKFNIEKFNNGMFFLRIKNNNKFYFYKIIKN